MNNNFQNVNTSTKDSNLQWWLSWKSIVIICIVFWPVGLYLIWKRTSIDKQAALRSGKVISIFGWISLFFSLVELISIFSTKGSSNSISGFIFYLLAGVGLIVLGTKLRNDAHKSKNIYQLSSTTELLTSTALLLLFQHHVKLLKKTCKK